MSSKSSLNIDSASYTLLVFGNGGHGRVVADAALLSCAWQEIYASDRDSERCKGQLLPGIPLLSLMSAATLKAGIHVAIGNNAAREQEAASWSVARLVSVLHPDAVVSKFAQLGEGCFVAAGAVVAAGAKLGTACIVNHGAVVDHDVQVGSYCHVAPLASLGGEVVLGKRVMVGAGANILPGVKIGDDVVIGAGAVVRTALCEPGIYVGVPARRVK